MNEVSPELAAKVLGADLRNLVKKVGDGATLSTAEREMMARYLTDASPPDELLKARKAWLTRKYITGGRLTPAEIKEAGLPDPKHIISRQTSDRYQKSQPIYSKLYGRDVRNLKRWVADGRKQTPPDLPPFDDPPLMAEWYRRVKHREPGANLAKFEAGAADEQDAQAGPASPLAPGTLPAALDRAVTALEGDTANPLLPPLPPMTLSASSDAASDIGLQQVKTLVIATYNQMKVAIDRNRLIEYSQLRREWQQLVQILRSWEKDIIKIQEGRGEVLRTREINTEIVNIFATMGQSFQNALIKVIRRFAPKMPEPEQRALSLSLRDGCFVHVKKTRYRIPWAEGDIIIDAEFTQP